VTGNECRSPVRPKQHHLDPKHLIKTQITETIYSNSVLLDTYRHAALLVKLFIADVCSMNMFFFLAVLHLAKDRMTFTPSYNFPVDSIVQTFGKAVFWNV